MDEPLQKCLICDRDTPKNYLEKHHLIPAAKKGKETILVCCDCADQIHILFTNKELQTKYNTLDSLRKSEKIQRWIQWISNKKTFGFCMKLKKKK
jgi:hypothetical protein